MINNIRRRAGEKARAVEARGTEFESSAPGKKLSIVILSSIISVLWGMETRELMYLAGHQFTPKYSKGSCLKEMRKRER